LLIRKVEKGRRSSENHSKKEGPKRKAGLWEAERKNSHLRSRQRVVAIKGDSADTVKTAEPEVGRAFLSGTKTEWCKKYWRRDEEEYKINVSGAEVQVSRIREGE